MMTFLFRSLGGETVPQRTPNWRPLSDLPMIASLIDGMLEDAKEHYATLLQAKDKPHVLDDATIERVERMHTERIEYLDLFAGQLARWRKQSPTSIQALEIARLTQALGALTRINTDTLNLVGELKEGTIDKILAKDDIELGLELLAGKFKR
jgi:hypothetical protein